VGDPDRFAELPQTRFSFADAAGAGGPAAKAGSHVTRAYSYLFDIFEFIDVFEERGVDSVSIAAGEEPLRLPAAALEGELAAIVRILEERPREVVLHPEWREATIEELRAVRDFVARGAREGWDVIISPEKAAAKAPSAAN
jgi:hypothetical protein